MDPELLKRLDAIGEKLGATGERLFSALVRLEVASAITALIGAVFACSLAMVYIRWVRRDEDRAREAMDGHPVYIFPGVVLVLVALFATIAALVSLPALFAPEGAALKALFGK